MITKYTVEKPISTPIALRMNSDVVKVIIALLELKYNITTSGCIFANNAERQKRRKPLLFSKFQLLTANTGDFNHEYVANLCKCYFLRDKIDKAYNKQSCKKHEISLKK